MVRPQTRSCKQAVLMSTSAAPASRGHALNGGGIHSNSWFSFQVTDGNFQARFIQDEESCYCSWEPQKEPGSCGGSCLAMKLHILSVSLPSFNVQYLYVKRILWRDEELEGIL